VSKTMSGSIPPTVGGPAASAPAVIHTEISRYAMTMVKDVLAFIIRLLSDSSFLTDHQIKDLPFSRQVSLITSKAIFSKAAFTSRCSLSV
jgi:hypothetical protein